jgi:hypothetical protein
MCRYYTQTVKFGDCLLQDAKQHRVERRLRSDWAPSTLVTKDPCPLTKDDEGLCIEAKKEKKTLASTRDEAGCPLCGIQVEQDAL